MIADDVIRMTVSLHEPLPRSQVIASRRRRVETCTKRVRCDGKFFRLGEEKFYVRGVTYGPFEPDAEGMTFPPRERVEADLALMCELGVNCVRIYHLPPPWLLELAHERGLKLFLDVAWPKNLTFIGDPELMASAHEAVHSTARQCGNHPAVFAISVVNEIPADIVRFCGRAKVEAFIDSLVATVKAEAPGCLVCFANFPTTEYLQPRSIDFVCFNVYLHDESVLRRYLGRLQNIAGDMPLLIGEYGIDTMHEQSESRQAAMLATHVRAVFDEGLAGTVIFSFTDEWHTHGHQVENWAFGLTCRDRSPKPAYHAVRELFHRAPQVADVELPCASIVICSYNGASTLEACLGSMQRLRYPGEYEVILVDDGSTDHTQQILRGFPDVRVVQQENMGLSHARNAGLAAARGEVIAFTDSDCEADEDWMYYLVLRLVQSDHAGVGGPNLPPDDGDWVARCVALAPGGPTHVMIDDRTAEHVPGCNMAFYRWALEEVSGFDPQFRTAGDDVDVIWRMQDRGRTIGFAAGAQVWHYRRNTARGYFRQQRGYGAAEALLMYKHPGRFNALGASSWRGRIYGGNDGDIIYHGLFGTGLFQTIYRQPPSMVPLMMMSLEWHVLMGLLGVLGLAYPPLWAVAGFMLSAPIVLSIAAATRAPLSGRRHWLSRPLIAYLHYRQPITRGWARYSTRLQQKVAKGPLASDDGAGKFPRDPHDPSVLRYWSTTRDRLALLDTVRQQCDAAGWRFQPDTGWGQWDLEIHGSRYVKTRLTTATEQHHGAGMLTRVRVEFVMSRFARVLLVMTGLLAGLLLLHLWPISQPAALIPLAAWGAFLIDRWRISQPILSLIDRSARLTGFSPVSARSDSLRQ